MSSNHLQGNTNPDELRRRLAAGGPMGFIEALRFTLDRTGYGADKVVLTRVVPDWLQTTTSREGLAQDLVETERKRMATVPLCIVYQFSEIPARRKKPYGPGGGGTDRQRQLKQMRVRGPGVVPGGDASEDLDTSHRRNREPGVPPLWDNLDHVPSFLRDKVDEDTVFSVMSLANEVYVDFVVVGPNEHDVHQLATHLKALLTFFHHRRMYPGSQLAGYPYWSGTGAPNTIGSKLPPDVAAHTVTWQLYQHESHAFPLDLVEQISVVIHGRSGGRWLPPTAS